MTFFEKDRSLASRACRFFFFSSRRRHTRFDCDWSSDVCSSDLARDRGRDLGDLARWCATRPAELAGLARKGRIAPGCDADLIVFDPEATFKIGRASCRERV